jgi:hypothetical protein
MPDALGYNVWFQTAQRAKNQQSADDAIYADGPDMNSG